jgi:hypothetical protein
MNIEKLGRNALEFLKTKESNFPKSGIIAGGSLGNLIWEQVSGNVAIVNDIDVFMFQKSLDINEVYSENTNTKDNKKLFYRSQEKVYWEDYTGLCQGTQNKEFYLIEKTENIGLINYVYYSATSNKPKLVVDSFDINCTQIGYDIDTDKFFWTKEFEQFLEDGKLRFTNLGSPQHSSIRILKKRDELNAILEDKELKLTAYTISKGLNGVTRRYFSDKYFSIYEKYEKELSKYFKIKKEPEISEIISKSKGIDINIYTLTTDLKKEQIYTTDEVSKDTFEKIWNCNDFLFYMRNVEKNEKYIRVWSKLSHLFTYDGYLDYDPSDDDINLLHRLIYNVPKVIKNLQGITMSKQVELVNRLFDTFKYDLTIPLALLEKQKIDPNIILDESTCLLLELSVRLEIINNNYKIDKILGTENKTEISENDIDLLF